MEDVLPEMACEVLTQCNLIFGILRCTLPQDTIDVDLKVCSLQGIHTYKKDRSIQVIKCSPCGANVQLFQILQKKMAEFMKHRQIITTPFANRSFQPTPRVATRECNLIPLTRPKRGKLYQPRKINVRPLPEATWQNGAGTLGKAMKWQAP